MKSVFSESRVMLTQILYHNGEAEQLAIAAALKGFEAESIAQREELAALREELECKQAE